MALRLIIGRIGEDEYPLVGVAMKVSVVNWVLAAAIAFAVGGVQLVGRDDAAVEASVRRYAAAISSSQLDAALAEIAPDQQDRWRDFVRSQLGNVYDVRGIAVRSPAVLEQLTRRRPGGAFEVTVVLDVNRDYPDEFYQPTPRVPVARLDGKPDLARPLLAPG
jgi:hypothetical protein